MFQWPQPLQHVLIGPRLYGSTQHGWGAGGGGGGGGGMGGGMGVMAGMRGCQKVKGSCLWFARIRVGMCKVC